ncbi:MAG: DUF4351 domain-containing protein [Planctomycetaceae bacterium]|jgi:hypothetical protein|nr:DUF4351 domain-containing protein [Planctomycetaceae bacterium]
MSRKKQRVVISDNKESADNKRSKESAKEKIYWHQGFGAALEIDLKGSNCEFVPEYQIPSNSIVDMLIKKIKSSNIIENDNNAQVGLAKYLHDVTLCEYKSLRETLSIESIMRLNDLCRRYCRRKKISRKSISALFLTTRFPREAMENLPKKWSIEKVEPGIYNIIGPKFSTTIAVLNQLSKKTYVCLTNLKNNLSQKQLDALAKESVQREADYLFAEYIQWLLSININKIKKGEIKMNPELMKVIEQSPSGSLMLKRYIKRGEAKGIVKGEAKGIAKGKSEARAEDIIRFLTRRFQEPPKKLQRQIMSVHDLEQLDELIDFAATCVSIGEFATAFN